MKGKSPAFQFYAAEFLADENVVMMNNREIGCYIKLLCYCWREGSIPADVTKIGRLCGEDSDTMAQLWLAIRLCFRSVINDESRLENPRLVEERNKQQEFKNERSESGKRGAKARWNAASKDDGSAISLANSSANKEPMAKNGSSSSSSKSPSLRSGDSPKKSELSLLTEKEIPEQLARDWLKIRKEKKQPLTETGLKATIREGAKLGYSLEQTITCCCENGWAGFRASYMQNKRDMPQQKPQYQSAADKQREQANRMFGGLTNERGREIDVSEDGAEWDRPALPVVSDNLR